MTSFATPFPGMASRAAGASPSGVLLRWAAWRLGLYGLAAIVSMAGAAGVMVAIHSVRPYYGGRGVPVQPAPPTLSPIEVMVPPGEAAGDAIALAPLSGLLVIKQASAELSLPALLDSPGTVVTMTGSAIGRRTAHEAELEKLRQAIRDGHGAAELTSSTGRRLVATLGKSQDVVIRNPSAAAAGPVR